MKPGSVSLLFLCVTCSSCSVNVCLVVYEKPIHLQKKAKSLGETMWNRRGKDREKKAEEMKAEDVADIESTLVLLGNATSIDTS